MSEKEPKEHGHQLLPVSLYLKIFFLLLVMIFVNMGIAQLPLATEWKVCSLLFVALIQTTLVAVFFMELIHEDKFYSFIFVSTILFVLLFFGVTLLEIQGRDFFTPLEGAKMMRQVDQNGNFAPEGPKFTPSKKSE